MPLVLIKRMTLQSENSQHNAAHSSRDLAAQLLTVMFVSSRNIQASNPVSVFRKYDESNKWRNLSSTKSNIYLTTHHAFVIFFWL